MHDNATVPEGATDVTVRQYARAKQISESTAYRLIRAGLIRAHRVGTQLRIPRELLATGAGPAANRGGKLVETRG